MTAALIGQFVGMTLACAGFAYICLAIMWVTGLYKRWPRQCVWTAAAFAALLGINTALVSPDDFALYLLGTAVAVTFVLYRGAKTWGKKAGATPPT